MHPVGCGGREILSASGSENAMVCNSGLVNRARRSGSRIAHGPLKGIENRNRSGSESENRNEIVNERSRYMMKTASMSGLMVSGKCVQAEQAQQVEGRS
jgi:hypothetical protein